MKNYTSLVICLLLMLNFFACSDEMKNNEDKEFETSKSVYIFQESMLKQEGRNKEIIALLSIKYELNNALTQKILNEFIERDDFKPLYDAKTMEELKQLRPCQVFS